MTIKLIWDEILINLCIKLYEGKIKMSLQEKEKTIATHADPLYRLKVKCNLQVEKIEELQHQLNEEREKNRHLQGDNSALKNEIKKIHQGAGQSLNTVTSADNVLFICINTFFNILKKITENNDFIVYKNFTKNSARYNKVEKSIFDNYLDEDPAIDNLFDKKTFFNICVDFAFLKADDNRKYIWNDNQVRIYFVSKTLINVLNGDYKDAN